jgi:hypothetical protein
MSRQFRETLPFVEQVPHFVRWGIFAYFAAKGGALSLRFRLAGGERGIRTLGTGLDGVRADVPLSYRESIFCPETEGLMPLRRRGKPVQFPVQSKGEWLAIL